MIIGVFLAQLDDAYQRGIWQGLTQRAAETGHGVLGFIGQRLDAPMVTEAAGNFAYRLAGSQNIDAAVVLASTFATFGGIEPVRTLLATVTVPQISAGIGIPGVPGVSVTGAAAMADLVRHLIGPHGRRRLALLAGPPGHAEAEEREAVFRAELAAAGLTFDPRLKVRGSFLFESGVTGARELLGTGLEFDALVCLNDQMAMGAMTVLREAGKRVPTDVVVTGFDDVWEAQWLAPPLTTVVQPLEELGRQAFDMAIARLTAGRVEDRQLECRAVFRQSCGCPPTRQFGRQGAVREPNLDPEDSDTVAHLRSSLAAGDTETFLAALDAALLRDEIRERDGPARELGRASRWHHVVPWLFEGRDDLSSLAVEAHALISAVEIRQQAAQRMAANDQHLLMRGLSAALVGSFSLQTLVEQLVAGLQRLGIRHGFLARFETVSRVGASQLGPARLLLALGGGPADQDPAAGAPFPSHQLLPSAYRGLFAAGVWILEPLTFQDEILGYLILSGDSRDPSVYENLRDQVSSALKGSLLMEQTTGHELELEREVLHRTKELRQMNWELTEGIAHRRVLEREIHEISDRTMQTIGQDLHDDLCQHLAGISMFAALLEQELQSRQPSSVEAVVRIRQMLEDAIVRTRQIARGLYPPGLEERGLVSVLEDLVDSLAANGQVRIDLKVEGDFSWLEGPQALHLFRIIQESIGNALRHASTPKVVVALACDGARATIEVRDFGRGLDRDPGTVGDRGLGLRTMRYRAESIGAVLTIEPGSPGVRILCEMDCSPDRSRGNHA
jgi:DNA-binding LacI/PurR family transcriptional regulator/signal transduction histidine kinase